MCPGRAGRAANLIYTQQVGQAYGYDNQKAGLDAAALEAVPAQELVRIRASAAPRNWPARWEEAGGRFFGGRMIALKSDPI